MASCTPNRKRTVALLQLILKFDPSRLLPHLKARPVMLCQCCGAPMQIVQTMIKPWLPNDPTSRPMTFPFRWLHNHPTKQTPPPFSRRTYDQQTLAENPLGLKSASTKPTCTKVVRT